VVHGARRLILDCLGVAVGASQHPSVEILLGVVDTLGGHPQATVWARGRRASLTHAPLVNGYLAHILDYDDSLSSEITVLHSNAPILPAALAVAEWRGASGGDLLLAFSLGFEVAARIALSAGRPLMHRHWHITSVVGGFGAAVAAGKLLGLDEQQLTYALGLAGAQAGGTGHAIGTLNKPFHPGRAAMSGVLGALLAERGLTSGEDFLTGRHGFHAVYQSDRDLEVLTNRLGEQWELRRAGFKPYACGIVVHALLDGLLALREEHRLRPDEVESVEARVNPMVLVPTGIREPSTGLEGKFSVFHSAAVALIDGLAGPAQYTDQRVNDPAVVDLRRRVEVSGDEALGRGQADVAILLRDGRRLTRHVPQASGSADHPLTDAQLGRKFESLVAPILGAERSARLQATVGQLEQLPHVEQLTAQL
jgi:2-methylcitrate dehydratase PrpD